MTRVLLVTDIFPPDIGGPATFIPALGTALQRLGHEVTVVCRAEHPDRAEDRAWPFRVRRFGRRGRAAAVQLMTALMVEARRHAVVFSNGLERQVQWACRAVGRGYVVKVVGDLAWERMRLNGLTQLSIDAFQHAPALAEPGRGWVARRQAFAQQARRVITPSHYLRRMVIGWGVPPERVVTVPNGVHLEAFAGAAPRPRAGADLRLLYVGRLVNWKGVDHLLRAVAGVPEARLTVVGEGPEAAALRALAATLGVEARVTWAGPLPRAATLQALREADALGLCSEYEGLSHTLLEACAAAVPSVASDCGGNPEVIEPEVSGLLVPHGDGPALTAALRRLAHDEALRLRLAAGALARSRAFDFHSTLTRTMEVLTASAPAP